MNSESNNQESETPSESSPPGEVGAPNPFSPPVTDVEPESFASIPYSVPQGLPEKWKKRQRKCVYLFFATCLSTFLIGSDIFPGILFQQGRNYIFSGSNLANMAWEGLMYAVPLMTILMFHEMGHYLQARRYGIPATLPFFIPLPIPPLGTMGAVIVQQSGAADRKQMFDIAVSGPLAGLVVAIPVLYYGVATSTYAAVDLSRGGIEFGEPLILQWMIETVHGPKPPGTDFVLTKTLFAGWVGILITALNLIPAGQLDGGHILYTLIGKPAHFVAYAVLGGAFAYMAYIRYPAYLLLFILIMFMGPKHPPTANDRVPLGIPRIIIGWLTLAFIIVGFTVRPMIIHEPPAEEAPKKPAVPTQPIAALEP